MLFGAFMDETQPYFAVYRVMICIFACRLSSSMELWVCQTEAPEWYLLLLASIVQEAGFGKRRFCPTFLSLFWIQRNCSSVSIFLTSLKQLEDWWSSAFCLTDTCPHRSCCVRYESTQGLHLLQYIYVNKRQLQNYIPIITITGDKLQKRQSAQGVQWVWKCLSNTCNK